MTMRGTFRFHPVGQGLFYSGLIQKPEDGDFRQFSFAYDCGSTSSHRFLRREVDDFKELLPCWKKGQKKRLDLLVVSHLHDDHVNGLEYLLKDVEVDTVVMPFMEQALRLLAWTESPGQEEFLRDFYADPAGWFSERGVRRILLIGSRGYDSSRKYDDPRAERNQRDAGREDIRIASEDIKKEAYINDTRILWLTAPAEINWAFYWTFRFSSLPLPELEEFSLTAKAFLNEYDCSVRDVFYSRKMKQELAGRLGKVLKAGRTINRTSLVMVHEPNTFYKTHFSAWNLPFIDELWYMTKEKDNKFYDLGMFTETARSTVLTGDVELENEDEMKKLGLDRPESYKVFQYPHHGAADAFPYALERKILPKNTVTVFSAGTVNKYGSPDPGTAERQHCPKLVNERFAFDYSITVR